MGRRMSPMGPNLAKSAATTRAISHSDNDSALLGPGKKKVEARPEITINRSPTERK